MRKSTVQKTGQITLPREIRRKLGIEPGDKVIFVLVDGGILIKTEKAARIDRLNQLLGEINQILKEEEAETGDSLSLEQVIEGIREERRKILKEKYGLDCQDD